MYKFPKKQKTRHQTHSATGNEDLCLNFQVVTTRLRHAVSLGESDRAYYVCDVNVSSRLERSS